MYRGFALGLVRGGWSRISGLMTRVGRILVNVGTLASFVVCAAAVVFWGRGCWFYDRYAAHVHERTQVAVYSLEGAFGVTVSTTEPGGRLQSAEDGVYSFRLRDDDWPGGWPLGRFYRHSSSWGNGSDPGLNSDDFEAPSWLCVGLSGAPAVVWWARRRRRVRRSREGCCVGCGYDLRATLGRCPECGMAVSARE